MYPLDVVKLTALMQITRGRPEIVIGLLDGPVAVDHPDLMAEHIRELPGRQRGTRPQANIAARMHGTFVAGMLRAKRGSAAPAICPDCTLLVHPIFRGTTAKPGPMPSATPEELATAIIESDWISMSFTMNWKLTRADTPVRFERALAALRARGDFTVVFDEDGIVVLRRNVTGGSSAGAGTP